jgi:hypothetical protein
LFALLGVIASHKSGLWKNYSFWHPFAATEDLIMVEEREIEVKDSHIKL